jgi:methyl-accepting chemotaxis protein
MLDAMKKVSAGASEALDKAVGYALANQQAASTVFLNRRARPLQEKWLGTIDSLIAMQTQLNQETVTNVASEYAAAKLIMSLCAALFVVLGLTMAVAIIKSITSPISYAALVAEAIAHGELDNPIHVIGSDESTSLMRSLTRMQDNLRHFARAQAEMGASHAVGEVDATMPAEAFDGVYGDMARSINSLAGSHLEVQQKIVTIVTEYGHGDLTMDMGLLPGKQARITEAMASVKRNLHAVNDETLRLADAAAQGNFKARGREEDFGFDFKRMVAALNRLMEVSDHSLSDVAGVLSAMASGDLTKSIEAHYAGTLGELKDDANATAFQLSEIVRGIRQSAESIHAAAQAIAAGTGDLSRRTKDQAASLESTAANMEEQTALLHQSADNAHLANELASKASDVALKGGAAVAQVVGTMESIRDSSRQIGDIIGVIDGIAFQTNILALNAAVEAARAGDQGRGFAVVASEVRSLAQRSAAAAKEIKQLISSSVEKVEIGSAQVGLAGQTMEEIVSSVKRVADIMSEITRASKEQSIGVDQVNRSIAEMDQGTQQNAALVLHTTGAAESLREQADELIGAVSAFQINGNDSGTFAVAQAAPRKQPVPHRKLATL